MSTHLDEIARVQFETEFGRHTSEVMNSGSMPGLQLRLQEVATSTPRTHSGWRPEFGDPEAYLQAVYNCLQQ